MLRIRRFDETVLENFPRGVFFGTTHTYLGQEADAVGVLSHLQPQDVVFSNHRCHGHFLAYGGRPPPAVPPAFAAGAAARSTSTGAISTPTASRVASSRLLLAWRWPKNTKTLARWQSSS